MTGQKSSTKKPRPSDKDIYETGYQGKPVVSDYLTPKAFEQYLATVTTCCMCGKLLTDGRRYLCTTCVPPERADA